MIKSRQHSLEDGSHTKSPLLRFPEGFTTNNTVLAQFKRGAFESGCAVTPASVRYTCPLVHVNNSIFNELQMTIFALVGWRVITAEVLVYPPF